MQHDSASPTENGGFTGLHSFQISWAKQSEAEEVKRVYEEKLTALRGKVSRQEKESERNSFLPINSHLYHATSQFFK